MNWNSAFAELCEKVIRKNHGWHKGDDGLGARFVFLNGLKIDNVVRANESKGVVIVTDSPVRLDKHRKRVLVHRLRGNVRVEFPCNPAA